MKKIITGIVIIFLFCFQGYGQQFYINAGAGYGCNEYYQLPQYKFYGTGSFGYYLSNRFNIEIAIDNYSFGGNGNIQYNYFSFDIIRVMPVLKFKINKSFNSFYLKVGTGFLNLDGRSISVFTSQNEFPPYNVNTQTIKISGSSFENSEWGYLFAIGKDTRIYENNIFGIYSFFVEFVNIEDFWQGNHISVTETTIPNPNPNDFSFYSKFYYRTIGIQMGIKYSFGKK